MTYPRRGAASESGTIGPGRPNKMQRCAYCGDELGVFTASAKEAASLCCGAKACLQEQARDEQRDGEYAENGMRTR